MATDRDKDKSQFMVGTCLGMCPYAEVRLRQRERLIHPLEMAVNSNGNQLNYVQPRAMVKEFSRSAAGTEIKASDIRPVPVLVKTMKYLLTTVCLREDVSWALVYQFVSDRLRAIQQDLCVQGIKNTTCIHLYQAAVRFYAYAHYRTCEHDLCDFDPYLNKKHLTETLTLVVALFHEQDCQNKDTSFVDSRLFPDCCDEEIWNDSNDDTSESKIVQDARTTEKKFHRRTRKEGGISLRMSGDSCLDQNSSTGVTNSLRELSLANNSGGFADSEISSFSVPTGRTKECENKVISGYTFREEAEALYLLVNFGNEEVLMHAFQLQKKIRCSRLVSVAIKMNIAWLSCNYYRVLCLSSILPPLFLCAFHPHLTMIQRKALSILSIAHNSKGLVYKQEDLAAVLCFPSVQELNDACRHYGFTVLGGGIIFNKAAFNWNISMG
ncbi:SAC3 domain-containing protein 1 isoform X3 [Cherax quadricarinatus]|uniref:SAC3 domain-containing protein 1 isoform X3 n=1 Tax=Cherax quadricarinatus TaxID=27406 RepID=UPI00387EBF0C